MERPEFPPPDWRCNSSDHNELEKCSNPECFNHDPPDPRWFEYEKWFHQLAEELFNKK